MMKKLLLLITLLGLTFSLVACGGKSASEPASSEKQEQTEDKPEEAVTQENEGGFLWKVEENDNTVYMLGSIHAATEDFYPLNSEIERAFNKSDSLAVEADILNVDPAVVQQFMNEHGVYQDGTTLADHVPEQLYYDLKDELKGFGVEIDQMASFEPWYVSMMIDNFRVMKMGYDVNLGIDYHFLKNAGDKEIIELEGMEFQLELFDNFSEAVQLKLLETSLMDIDQAKEELDTLATSWKNGDLEKVEEIVLTPPDDSEEYEQFIVELLDKRNIGMVDKIEGFLNGNEKATYFVIVGAGHYVGDQGLVNLLKDKGYTVERLIK